MDEDTDGNSRKLHYRSAGTGLSAGSRTSFAIFVQDNEGEHMYYMHKPTSQRGEDYLGSFQSITNEEGELVEKYAFDPCSVTHGFGKPGHPNPLVELIPLEAQNRERRRRNPDNWSFNDVPENSLFDRGYTGLEHLDDFGLINPENS